MSKELIRLDNCTTAFDNEIVLDHINLYINDKEFLTLLGPSGCGKTTTLRIIGGFQTPTSGDVLFNGVRMNSVPPYKRAINTVFQKYALFPHLNVYENIAFGLRIPKADADGKKVKLSEKEIHSRPDIIFATGRSDYPNQINNVLGFPYIFRGALDVLARSINEEMKLAATYALAELTKEPVPENVKMAYNDPSIAFGRNYIIPIAFHSRLISRIAPAVAIAAIESGVARTEIEDWDAYRDQLEKRMGQDERLMRRMTRKAKTNPKRIVFAEGADIKTLMAVQEILSEKIAHPILIGNKTEIETLQKQYKLELPELTIFDPTKEIDKIDQYTQADYEKRQRKGIILEQAKELMKNPNFIGLMMVESGEADGFISGIHSNYHDVLRAAKDIIGLRACCKYAVGMHIVTNKKGTYFLADTTVNSHPSADTLECVTVLTYEAVKQFNVEPVVALTSYSNFGEYRLGSPAQIQEAVDTLHRKYPEILVDGEMSASIAFNTELRQARFPFSPLANKDVNTIIFPNLSSGSIALGILQELGNNEIIGPVLLGLNKPVHILQMGCSVRDIVYMTTLAVTDAQKEMPVDMCRI